jgi:hypothetical protein
MSARSPRRLQAALLVLGIGAAAVATAGTIRSGYSQADGYGHLVSGAAADCPYTAVDISATGTVLTLTAADGSVTALDDGAAVIALAAPFEFYGQAINSIVASTNAYLAIADSLGVENGGDFSNDPYLPAVPENTPAAFGRIDVYHDELTGEPSGQMTTQYFATCPRASEAIGTEACSVVQWKNFAKIGNAGTLDVQAILYHASSEIVLQHTAVDASAGNSACVGIQDPLAADGGAWSCNGTHPIIAGSAVCFIDPAHPPVALDRLFANGFE